jgi:hypothetical protein
MLLKPQLELDRCPHCQVDKPSLFRLSKHETSTHDGENTRFWSLYKCARCGGLVLAASDRNEDGWVTEIYPEGVNVNDSIPEKAKKFLTQALQSLHAPSGAIMLCASSVDAMLKEKDYKDGSLYKRINDAVIDHLITSEMAQWAHEVRLDANDQRHIEEELPLPNEKDAKKCVDFVLALGEFLFVLPAKVQRGLKETKK